MGLDAGVLPIVAGRSGEEGIPWMGEQAVHTCALGSGLPGLRLILGPLGESALLHSCGGLACWLLVFVQEMSVDRAWGGSDLASSPGHHCQRAGIVSQDKWTLPGVCGGQSGQKRS